MSIATFPAGEPGSFMQLHEAFTTAEKCRAEGRLVEAESICRRLLEARPEMAEVEHLLGIIMHQTGKLAEAIGHLQRAVDLAPHVALFHANLAEMFRLAGNPKKAAEESQRALAIEPAMPAALTNLGVALYELGELEEAVDKHKAAIAANPNFTHAHSNLGNALHALRRFDEAIASYRRAIELDPNFADAWANLGITLQHAGQFEEAALALRRAIAIAPDHANARSGLGILLLMRGDFGEGWQEYEWRLRSTENKGPRFPEKPWQGDNLSGKHIYVKAEQGLGDTIQFARYLPLLSSRAGKVTARVQQPLVTLLRTTFPNINFLGESGPTPDHDCDAALLNLPRLFQTRLESIPALVPYLRPPADVANKWKARFKNMEGLKVGIVWAGNPKHLNDPRRSLDLSFLSPIFAIPGLSFVSLQVGSRAADLDNLPHSMAAISDVSRDLTDFSETAGAVDALDLIISVDTSVAHLAGALAKPAWVLLPWVTDWRWMLERSDCPWYPTMTLFRQKRTELWVEVVSRLSEQLQRVLGGDSAALTPFKSEGERQADEAKAIIATIIARDETRDPKLKQRPPAKTADRPRHKRTPGAHRGSDEAELAHGRGIAAHRSGKLEQAIEHLRRAVTIKPDIALYHANLGEVYRLSGRLAEAVEAGRRALEIDPAFATARNNLGIAYFEQGKFEEALAHYDQAIALRVDFAQAHNNRGNALQALKRFDEAITAYRRAVEIMPDFVDAWTNMGTTLQDCGKFDEAAVALRRAITLAPAHAKARSALGMILLLRGEFAEGWGQYEWRLRGQRFPTKPWRGENVEGKHLYVQAEQGLGDTIQFARYLPLLAERGCKVTAHVQEPLVKLLRESLPGITVIGNRDGTVSFDCDVALLSLPHLLRTRLETIPGKVPYLHPPRDIAARWRARLASMAGLKVGLAWAGNPIQPNDSRRSLQLSVLKPLFSITGASFASLQVGPQANDLDTLADDRSAIIDLSPDLSDFAETAGAISALDLIISVDTSVSHLAGALGKPIWVPLTWVTDWRYLIGRPDSPWYPTMRLFRQEKGENWDAIIARIEEQLERVIHGETGLLTPFKADADHRAGFANAIFAKETVIARSGQHNRTVNPGRALMVAKQKHRSGFLAEADELTRRAIAAEPNNAEAAHMLGIVANQSGKLDEAIGHLRRAVALDPTVPLYHANLGEMYRRAGRLEEAILAGRRALELKPDFPNALSNLGIALYDQGKLDDALEQYDRAIAFQDDFAQAHSNRGNALLRMKRFGEAEQAYRRAIDLQPNFADGWNNLGTSLRDLRRLEEAELAYRKALELEPNNPDTLDNLALALNELERKDEALAILRRALAIAPGKASLHVHRGAILLDQEKIDEAAVAAKQAVTLNDNDADALNLMGRVVFRRGEVHSSVEYYRRALELKPDLSDAYNNMGNVLKELGQLEEANRAYIKGLEIDPDKASIYFNFSDSRKFAPGDEYFEHMERLFAKQEGLSLTERMYLDFALGKAYADLRDYDRSFEHLASGNATKRAMISYEEQPTLGFFDRIEAIFTPDLIDTKSGAGDPSSMPIFILGMPRSGTSLVEQIIASHPMAYGAGELRNFDDATRTVKIADVKAPPYPELAPLLTSDAFYQIGNRYLSSLQKLVPGSAQEYERVSDKMPSNYYFAGLIHLALPNATIIHTVRDPVDTCLSCFSKLFASPQNHTYDLGEIGRYYLRYQRLMDHWHRVLPPGRILDVRYEDVVENIENEARRIIAHCGLPWDDRCLSFHATDRPVRTASASQVRQPIYKSSVGRWRVYGDRLAPLLTALGMEPSS